MGHSSMHVWSCNLKAHASCQQLACFLACAVLLASVRPSKKLPGASWILPSRFPSSFSGFQGWSLPDIRCRSLSRSHVQTHCPGHYRICPRLVHRRCFCTAIGRRMCSLLPCWQFHAPSSGPVFGLASSTRRCTQSHTSGSWRCISSGRFVRPALHLQLTSLLHPVLYPTFAGDFPQSGFHLLWHLLQCVDFHAPRLA